MNRLLKQAGSPLTVPSTELLGVPSGIVKCITCVKSFIIKQALKSHESSHQPSNSNFENKCQVCDKVIARTKNLKQHMQINKETNNVNFFTDLINDAIESAIGLNTEIIYKIVIEKINNTVEKPK